jgi:hypothetical protein
MGMAMFLISTAVGRLSLGPEAASRLAILGVTFASVLSDEEGTAVVLDGAGFDPSVSAGAALEAIGARHPVRRLEPIAQLAISPKARS